MPSIFSPTNSSTSVVRRDDIAETYRELDLEMQQRMFIANMVLPFKRVRQVRGQFKKMKLDQLLQVPKTGRAPGSAYNSIGFQYEYDTYDCKEYGLTAPIDDREAAIADIDDPSFESDVEAALITRHSLMLAHEARVAAAIDANVSDSDAASAVWTTEATDVRGDVKDNKIEFYEKNGVEANALIVSYEVFEALLDNDDIIDRVQHVRDARAAALNNPQLIAGALNIEYLLVHKALTKTTPKGASTPTLDYLWDETKAYLLKISMGESIAADPGVGKTFAYTGDGAEPMGTVEQYRDEHVRSWIQRVRNDVDPKIVHADLIHAITGVAA